MKSAFRAAKNFTKGYSDIQIKVRDATSNEGHGPTMGQLEEIANATFHPTLFADVIYIFDKRLNDHGKYWRHVYKTLVVLEFCICCGSESVVNYAKECVYIIKTLKEFQFIDETGRDQGANVRQKSKELAALLSDEERLAEARRTRSLPFSSVHSFSPDLAGGTRSSAYSRSSVNSYGSHSNSTGNHYTLLANQYPGTYSSTNAARSKSNSHVDSGLSGGRGESYSEARELQRAIEESKKLALQENARRNSATKDSTPDQFLKNINRQGSNSATSSSQPERAPAPPPVDLLNLDGDAFVQTLESTLAEASAARALHRESLPAIQPSRSLSMVPAYTTGLPAARYSQPPMPTLNPFQESQDNFVVAPPSQPAADPFADIAVSVGSSRNRPHTDVYIPRPLSPGKAPLAAESQVGAKPVMPFQMTPQYSHTLPTTVSGSNAATNGVINNASNGANGAPRQPRDPFDDLSFAT